MDKKKVTVIIPAFNEASTIPNVIKGVKHYVDEVIVVNDASTDNTADLAKTLGAYVLSHERNEGYDKSIDDGFALAANRGADIILTFDADGQHNPEDIKKIIDPILKDEADVVVGKRPGHARITEYIFSFIAMSKASIKDPLCGLKAYRREVYDSVGYFDRIKSIGTQLVFNAKSKGYRIMQKDILINKRKDISRFGRRIKANWRIAKAIVKTVS